MDFFSAQEQSRRTTRLLIVFFSLAIVAIVSAVTLISGALLGGFRFYDENTTLVGAQTDWVTLGLIALGTGLFIGLASLYRTARLRQGGATVARALGGTEIAADTTDPLRRRLFNVVEEMSIASGVPVPEIFVLEREPGINAFAAGFGPNDAAVAVTQGTLEHLNRDELQGVIGHEFSHILNGDMRINMRLIGVLYGILVLSLIGRLLLRGGRFSSVSRRDTGGAPLVVLGLGLAVIGSIGVLFGRLIKAAVSRQREYLADASAVQFTRDPEGLAGALKKIGGFGSNLDATDGEEVAHMLFSRGASSFRGWFATHPPLEKRIQALDPHFTGPATSSTASPMQSSVYADTPIAGIAAGMVGRAGQPSSAELEEASELRSSMPNLLTDAAHSREGSWLLIVALALNSELEHRDAQLGVLRSRLGEKRANYCEQLSDSLTHAGVGVRLPLLEMAFPRVKDRPASQLQFLVQLIDELVAMDNIVEPFELALVRTLETYLREQPNYPTDDKKVTADAQQIEQANVDLIAGLAAYSHDEPALRLSAMQRGLAALTPSVTGQQTEPERNLARVDAALSILATTSLASRRQTLIAAYACIRADDNINLAEGELFRAIAAVLGCPLPPFTSH